MIVSLRNKLFTSCQKFFSILNTPIYNLRLFLKSKEDKISFYPFILSTATLIALLVLFRMKCVEIDYSFHELNKKINTTIFENKELKAEKARLLSIRNLKLWASDFNLDRPKANQVIVVPTK